MYQNLGPNLIYTSSFVHITTGQHYFWPQLRFDIVGDFIAKTTEVDISEIWGQSSNETVSEAYKELAIDGLDPAHTLKIKARM